MLHDIIYRKNLPSGVFEMNRIVKLRWIVRMKKATKNPVVTTVGIYESKEIAEYHYSQFQGLYKLGPKQKAALKLMADGWHIAQFNDYSNSETLWDLSNDVTDDSKHIDKRVAISLVEKITLISSATVYTTVQPDTENIVHSLRKEFGVFVRNCLK